MNATITDTSTNTRRVMVAAPDMREPSFHASAKSARRYIAKVLAVRHFGPFTIADAR